MYSKDHFSFPLQKAGLEGVSEWLPLTEEWLPEVMILVCDRVSENGRRPKESHPHLEPLACIIMNFLITSTIASQSLGETGLESSGEQELKPSVGCG